MLVDGRVLVAVTVGIRAQEGSTFVGHPAEKAVPDGNLAGWNEARKATASEKLFLGRKPVGAL